MLHPQNGDRIVTTDSVYTASCQSPKGQMPAEQQYQHVISSLDIESQAVSVLGGRCPRRQVSGGGGNMSGHAAQHTAGGDVKWR